MYKWNRIGRDGTGQDRIKLYLDTVVLSVRLVYTNLTVRLLTLDFYEQ